MRFVLALLRALLAVLLAPLRLLGFGGQPTTPASIAAAAMEAEAGEGDPDEAASHPLGELVRLWAIRRRYGAQPGGAALAPLPPLVDAWLGQLDRGQLALVAMTPPSMLERHIAAGPDGQLKSSLGLVVPQPDVPALPANDDAPARPDRRGEPSLDEVLSDLGYTPKLRYRG
ncbi:hypothetical protein FV226_15225 [Methylobacterium sp. WL12]|uniref:hypothetical protein n=1 Tax=Methylobacterium sp. WL12 TaxID=2603890 RepID=UPI0011CA2C1C|nr:hypothetical protein [Methylobacterium sp. WL12]TXM71414.1 hypothetical protein FV226_15225 [Methylobacterium sp. WL12]